MPGSAACGRCGSVLNGNLLTIDVHPPRAGAWAKRLRRWLPTVAYYGASDRAGRVRESVRRISTQQGVTLPARDLALRMVAPGWALIHAGRRSAGRLYQQVFAGLLLVALVFYGTVLGFACFGLAFRICCGSCWAALPNVIHRCGAVRGCDRIGVRGRVPSLRIGGLSLGLAGYSRLADMGQTS
jgi:hypothetical protein